MIDIRLQENLELMAEMQSNSVDLIYCDILYGTGRNFGDYQDLKASQTEIDTFYYPRIKEMYRILKPTGSIYLQMDYRISHWIRLMLDKVFGYDKFINEIIWEYPKSIKNSTDKELCNHDNIFHYSKENTYTHNIVLNDYTKQQLKRFKHDDENGKYYFDTRRDNEGNKKKVKVYLKKTGTPLGDVWYFNFAQGKENIGYATQKPKELIKRIILASSNENDLVADFFAGSFTTAEVCKDLNRNFIGCDINPKGVNIGLARCGFNCP